MSTSESSSSAVNIHTPTFCKLIIPLNGGHEMSIMFTEQEDGQWAAVLPSETMSRMKADFIKMFAEDGFRLDSDKFIEIREV